MTLKRPSRAPRALVPSLTSWDTLPLRLAVLINATVILVVGAFWIVDYRRERDLHLQEQENALREEAKVPSLSPKVSSP